MPIPVECPKCGKKFTVSDKFAGQKGPCPNCKAPIQVPKLEAPDPAKPEVKIHEPEQYATAPKSSASHASVRPISRKETRLTLLPAAICVAAAILVVAVTWLARAEFQSKLWLRVVGLLLISAPIARGGYAILRNDELEAYRGKWLWLRSAICALVYIGLWGAIYFLPSDFSSTIFYLMILALPFFGAGGLAALACFDLDFTNGVLHHALYVLATLALGWLAGLQMPWASIVL